VRELGQFLATQARDPAESAVAGQAGLVRLDGGTAGAQEIAQPGAVDTAG
jgi:hypothetical protein